MRRGASTTAGVDGQNLSANHDWLAPVRDIATAAGISLGGHALATLSAKQPDVMAIPHSRNLIQIRENPNAASA